MLGSLLVLYHDLGLPIPIYIHYALTALIFLFLNYVTQFQLRTSYLCQIQFQLRTSYLWVPLGCDASSGLLKSSSILLEKTSSIELSCFPSCNHHLSHSCPFPSYHFCIHIFHLSLSITYHRIAIIFMSMDVC